MTTTETYDPDMILSRLTGDWKLVAGVRRWVPRPRPTPPPETKAAGWEPIRPTPEPCPVCQAQPASSERPDSTCVSSNGTRMGRHKGRQPRLCQCGVIAPSGKHVCPTCLAQRKLERDARRPPRDWAAERRARAAKRRTTERTAA